MIEPLTWKRTHYSSEVTEKDKEVIVMGWARAIRGSDKLKFIQLADRSGTVQIIVKMGDVKDSIMKKIGSLTRESVIAVKGKVKESKEAPGGIEIIPKDIKILNTAEKLPMEIVTKKTEAELPTRLDWRILDLRKPEIAAIFKIQSRVIEGMYKWLFENGFVQVSTPCLKGAQSESGAALFSTLYFGKEAYLREDPQLHRQLVVNGGLDKIFEFGPSWRAEKSNTTRHLCEHRGFAVEVAFIKDEYDIMKIEEKLLVAGLKFVQTNCKKELEILGKKISIPKLPLPVLEFPEIYKILKIKERELTREDEVELADYVQKKYKSDYFFINKFPDSHKPFYVYSDGKYARSTDLEGKGGIELSSGGQREHRYEILMKRIKEKGLNSKNLEWYTKFFKYAFAPHGGFMLGIERLTMVMLDLPNIREAVLFPRDPDRLLP